MGRIWYIYEFGKFNVEKTNIGSILTRYGGTYLTNDATSIPRA
jgi:hypothetical protein